MKHDSHNVDEEAAINETLEKIISGAKGSPILAIIPGAETGVHLAEKLASLGDLRINDESTHHALRKKFNALEAVREAGLKAPKQQLCSNESDVQKFIADVRKVHSNGSYKCIVKPNESVRSDSVFLCTTVEETLDAYRAIDGHPNGLGHVNHGALCQEFLTGTEFAVDGVSHDGVYKVTAIWEYDKRSVNGANFVYFGMFLRGVTSPREKALIEYASKMVKSLGIVHGPSHMEVMYDPVSGPCLVEVGTRVHGGEGTWLPVVEECLGYSQLEGALSCYLRPDRFDALPFEPSPHKHGCEAFLVSYQSGTIKDIPGLDEIRGFSSFRRMELMTQPGATLSLTTDCFSRPGSVQMVNNTAEGLLTDYQRIRSLENSGLFALM